MKEKNQINKTTRSGYIIGEPGVGMSTSFKQFLLDAISKGEKIIVIDPEEEYRNLQKEDLVKNNYIIKWKGKYLNDKQSCKEKNR